MRQLRVKQTFSLKGLYRYSLSTAQQTKKKPNTYLPEIEQIKLLFVKQTFAVYDEIVACVSTLPSSTVSGKGPILICMTAQLSLPLKASIFALILSFSPAQHCKQSVEYSVNKSPIAPEVDCYPTCLVVHAILNNNNNENNNNNNNNSLFTINHPQRANKN